jgi:hypothetical protein
MTIHKNAISNVTELYPARYHDTHETTVRQLCVPGKGWIRTPGYEPRLTHKTLISYIKAHGITAVQLTIPARSTTERARYPDYSVTELVPASDLKSASNPKSRSKHYEQT